MEISPDSECCEVRLRARLLGTEEDTLGRAARFPNLLEEAHLPVKARVYTQLRAEKAQKEASVMAKTLAGWWKKNSSVAATVLALAAVCAFSTMHAQQSQPTVLLSDGSQAPDPDPSQDPPSQVARISTLNGNVSYEPASVDNFAAAELNYPLTTGDRLYADASSNAEFQTGNLAVRMGALTDLTVTALSDTLTQLGLAQGVVHLRSYQLDPNTTVELDTPNVAITVLQPGDVRVETDPTSDTTLITVFTGQVQLDGNGIQVLLKQGESVQLRGSQPVSAQWMQVEPQDAFDAFSAERDAQYANASNAQGNDVNPETIGADDLAQNGQWQNDPDNGPVWYPTAVAVDWEPYRNGHWVWVAPWGWTWVEAERWGFAPFHYGRWGRFGNRWGWVPGPPVVRPIWSPALVVFVGTPGFTAWFPLGPREPFIPWYHASTLYVNRVNVSNIYNRNAAQVRSGYNQRATSLYPHEAGNNNYVNRRIATTAMPQDAFAAGHPAARNMTHGIQTDMANAPIIPHPLVTPQRTSVVSAPARALPPHTARPTLASRQDTRVTALSNPTSVAGPRGPVRTPPQQVAPAPITRAPMPPVQAPNPTHGQPPQTVSPPRQPQPQPAPQPTHTQPYQVLEPNPTRGQSPMQAAPRQSAPEPQPLPQPAPRPERPLFNKAVPPEPHPNFEQQRQAIEQTDPGRPLSPNQMQNVRQNQPPGPPQQREAAHPVPAPASRPAPPPPPRNDEKKK